MQFFIYNNVDNRLEIDEYSILLIKEFKDLWEINRNKCKEDKTGKQRLRAMKELTYIYLVLDYKSPYYQYTEKDKHEAAFTDSELTEEQLKDEKFLAAFRKYREIQESDNILSNIRAAHKTLQKFQIWLENIDFENDVDSEGRLLYKPKEILDNIAGIAKMRDSLIALEETHKKNMAAESRVRGDQEVGYMDN